jgi:hypothetical protein
MLTAEVAIVWIFLVFIASLFALVAFLSSNPKNALIRVVGDYWSSASLRGIRKWVWRVILFFFLMILVLTCAELYVHGWLRWLREP